jgi:aminopeptidase N
MIRLISLIWFLTWSTAAGAQVPHLCSLHLPGNGDYENPLEEKWLSAYDVKYYRFDLTVSNVNTEISGVSTILVETLRETDTLVFELQDALEVSSVELGEGSAVTDWVDAEAFSHVENALFIPLGSSAITGDLLQVRITYGGEAGQDRGFFAGISCERDPAYGFDVTYTLSEPLNASDWFPVKQVLTDQIDSVDMNLTCGNHLMAASNGVLQEIEAGPDQTHTFKWSTRYLMAYYLISFAVADYRDLSFKAALSGEGDSVLVQNYIYDDDRVMEDWESQIRETGPLITTFSSLLMDYPFSKEKYGHAMAPLGGGMEHQTMTTLQDFSFFLVAHELAHQWFGDYITCGNWQDIWINEGFASYMEYVAAQELLGQATADSWMANAMAIALSRSQGSVFVPEDEVEDNYRLFDYGLTYKKGAVLLHMIRYLLDDDEMFFGALRHYLDLYGNSLATGEEFRELLEAYTGMDFSCFFDQWYYGEGYPRFQVQWIQNGDSLVIRSEQTTTSSATPFFRTPFDLELHYLEGGSGRIRLTQGSPVLDTAIEVSGVVEEVLFDPDGWLLKSVSVLNTIPEFSERKQFVIGPNPVTRELRIRFLNNARIDRIVVTNMAGQEVWSREEVETPAQLDLSPLSSGPYLLVLYDDDRTFQEPFIKIDP